MIITKFKINRNSNIIDSKNNLLNFINKFCNQSDFNTLAYMIGKKINIPKKYLINQTKIYLFLNYLNIEGRFKKKFSMVNLFKDFFFFFIKFNIIFFKSKKKFSTKKYELLIDDIDRDSHVNKFKNLSKLFNTIFFSTVDLCRGYDVFKFKNYEHCIRNESIANSFKTIFILALMSLKYSLKTKNNLFPIVDNFYKNYLIYESLFLQIKAKYLLHERHYNCNEIRNYLFKKHGGICTAVTQKNILQYNGPGMFIYADIIFTLGKKSAEDLENMGGKVFKKIPVGSLAMEYSFFNIKKKIKNRVKKFDLIVLCSDNLAPFHSGYHEYYNNFYKHYEWIRKFAKKFPLISIGLKNKNVTKDKKVIEIFKGVSNVKFLFSNTLSKVSTNVLSDNYSNSYFYADKAKVLATWISTVGYEFFSQNKKTFFLDPGFRNTAFLRNKKYIKYYKIPSYAKFEKKIINELNVKTKIVPKFKYNFCLKSNNVSKKIYSSLKKINLP